jgi:hypothetical protein
MTFSCECLGPSQLAALINVKVQCDLSTIIGPESGLSGTPPQLAASFISIADDI